MADDSQPPKWTFGQLAKCLTDDYVTWTRLRSQFPEWRADLYRQNFSGCDLSGKDLRSCILYDCDFSNANLERADLSRCIAQRATFRNARLVDANLEGASVREANFNFADLTRANLTAADVFATSFQGATLVEASLKNTDLRYILFSSEGGANPADLSAADLRGAKLMTAADGGVMTIRQAERLRLLRPSLELPFSGKHYVPGSMLELLTTRGLESARFETVETFVNYVEAAFLYITDLSELAFTSSPEDVRAALAAIRYLNKLYDAQGPPPDSLIAASDTAARLLVDHLRRHPTALYALRPRQFEELIADVLSSFGWEVQLTQATRDGGYDIFAVSPIAGGLKTSWIVECKKYAPEHRVGLSLVRSLYGLKVDMKVANALLATTSTFTRDAHQYAATRYDLHLTDFERIVEWLRNVSNPTAR